MNQRIQSNHVEDSQGNPAGGCTFGDGLCIGWQNGPLGRGDDRLAANGAFVEGVIAAARDRLAYYQTTPFSCQENADAIEHLDLAVASLGRRTARREAAGTEGTHDGN